MKYNRFLVLLMPVIVFILLESVFLFPGAFYFILFLVNLSVLGPIFLFFENSKYSKEWRYYANEIILPFSFLTSIFIYFSLATNKLFVQFLFLVVIFFAYFYLRNIYYFFAGSSVGKSDLFKNILSLVNFFIIFFSASVIYGLQAFLNLPVWISMIFWMAISILAVYQKFLANRTKQEEVLIYMLVCSVVFLEIGWAMSFLPLTYNVLGLTMALCYYVLVGLVVAYFNDNLTGKKIKAYLIFGILSILLIFLTARWM